eukprot:GEMP01002365.1.p1 GENE.GEMP01002365.1~~GEMP01002365.1.p1  ORF type:complete len:1349 (+),score=316.83 GEMP01002365.1:25-4047(+)
MWSSTDTSRKCISEEAEDHLLYTQLLRERERIQRKLSHRQTHKEKEQEDGFQVYISGANKERIERQRRREKEGRKSWKVKPVTGTKKHTNVWQMETVEIRGADGQLFRVSPETGRQAGHTPSSGSHPPSDLGNYSDEEFHSECSERCDRDGGALPLNTKDMLEFMQTADQEELKLIRRSLGGEVSLHKEEAERLVDRVRKLDACSQRALLRLVNDLENDSQAAGADDNDSQAASVDEKQYLRPLTSARADEPERDGEANKIHHVTRPKTSEVDLRRSTIGQEQIVPTALPKVGSELTLRFKTSWGDPKWSICHVETISNQVAKKIPPASINCKNVSEGATSLQRLVKDGVKTSWTFSPSPDKFPEIAIVFLDFPEALRIYNGLDDRGVRECEVLVDGRLHWSGDIFCHTSIEDPPTVIPLTNIESPIIVSRGKLFPAYLSASPSVSSVTPASPKKNPPSVSSQPSGSVPSCASSSSAVPPGRSSSPRPPLPPQPVGHEEPFSRSPHHPVWLQLSPDSHAKRRAQTAHQDAARSESGLVAASEDISGPRNSARRRQDQDNLLKSFEALERFTTSHSRRFFSRAGESDNNAERDDDNSPFTRRAYFSQDGWSNHRDKEHHHRHRHRARNNGRRRSREVHSAQDFFPSHCAHRDTPVVAEEIEPFTCDSPAASPISPPNRVLSESQVGPLVGSPIPSPPIPPRSADSDDHDVINDYNTSASSHAAPPIGRQEKHTDCWAATDALDGLLTSRPGTALGTSLCGEQVTIPELPTGQHLTFNLVSTWGDNDFVALAGIEIFTAEGQLVVLKDVMKQVCVTPAAPSDSKGKDPRTVDKLFDQVNLTRDDLHVWLAPFYAGELHAITVDLGSSVSIAMIRIWNYNRNRLLSGRGVQDIEILLDFTAIFAGAIRRAPGLLSHPEQACEHILFTVDEDVLAKIEENDWLSEYMPLSSDDEEVEEINSAAERPLTAENGIPYGIAPECQDVHPTYTARVFMLVLHSSWSRRPPGLTAVRVLDQALEPVVDTINVEEPGGEVLFDEHTCTLDTCRMWLASCNNATFTFTFPKPAPVAALAIWNYNGIDTTWGTKEFSLYLDNQYVGTYVARKAPGHVNFDFKQLVILDSAERVARKYPNAKALLAQPFIRQQYETPVLPSGFILKLVLLSSWADAFYVGLDNVQVIDASGTVVRPARIHSNFGSVQDLPGMEDDIRTVDGLCENRMWLCPRSGTPGLHGTLRHSRSFDRDPNTVELFYNEPIAIACVKIGNYTRTPSRGVCDVGVYVDDNLVYQGILKQKEISSILFTDDSALVRQYRADVYVPSADELVLMFDDDEKKTHKRSRPQTAVKR